MRIDGRTGDAANFMLTGVTALSVDGVPFTPQPPTPDTGGPVVPGERLIGMYFDGDHLGAAVLRLQPDFEVKCDGNRLPGCGWRGPTIYYHTDQTNPLHYVLLDNPDHEYFNPPGVAPMKSVDTLVKAAPLVADTVRSLNQGGNPLSLWETAKNTTDPATMSFLIMYAAGQGGKASLLSAMGYRIWYYKNHGRQAVGGGINHEVITDAQLAAFQAFPDWALTAMVQGQDPGIDIPK